MKDLQEALNASKRNLDLTVARRKLLEEKVVFWENMQQKGAGSQPFFYSAVGSDGELGVVTKVSVASTAGAVGMWNDIIYRGSITIQNDTPFIWTHIGLCIRYLTDATNNADAITRERVENDSIFQGTRGTIPNGDAAFDFRVGFNDKSSGQTLYQGVRKKSGSPQTVGSAPSAESFSLRENSSTSHGPLGLWAMPQEVVLPTSATLEAQVQSMLLIDADKFLPLNIVNRRFRVYVTIGGYKVTT